MNITLEDQLVEYGRTIEHSIAAHDDGTGGRRHADPSTPPLSRPRVIAGVGASAALVGGLVAVSVVDSGPTAWAGWTPSSRDADPLGVATLDAACRAEPGIGPTSDALAFDVRGDGGLAIYGDRDSWSACQAELDDGASSVSGVLSRVGDDLGTARAALDRGQPVVTIALQWQGDPASSLIWGVRDPDVDSIVVSTSSGPVNATLLDDIWVAWWPTSDAETTTVRAESDGHVLLDEPSGSLAAPLPSLGVIAADVETDGTPQERATFEDGVVTWDEMTAALEAWHDCVAERGHEMGLQIDDGTQTYSVSTPIVSIEGRAGAPDDAAAAELLAPIEAVMDRCRTTHVSRTEQAFLQP